MTIMLDRPTLLAPGIDADLTRRRFLGSGAALGGVLLIGGCADDEDEPLVAASPTQAKGFAFTGDDGERIDLDRIPERVVAWMPVAATLKQFGVPIAGVWGPPELARGVDFAGVPSVGNEFLVQIESMAAIRPDLILGTRFNGEFSLPQEEEFSNVKAIGPLLRLESNSDMVEMIAAHERLAIALGVDPASAALPDSKNDLAEARQELRAALAANPELTVLCLALNDENVYVSYLDQATLRDLRDLGMNVRDNTEQDEAWDNGFSWELVPTLEADLILWDQRPRFRTPEDLADHLMPTALHHDIDADATRRRFLQLIAAAGLLAGCADDSGDPLVAASPTPTQAPVKVSHKYGETEVPTAPTRVVSLGFVDHDALLALGVVPVGIGGDSTSDLQRSAVWPWAHDKLGGAQPEVLNYTELNLEAIAALAPDLITGFTSGMTEQEYRQLSAIAPTVAQLAGFPDYFAPWQEVTQAAGRALGKLAEAEALIDGVEQAFADARAEHPEFDGVQAAYGGVLQDGFYTENSRSSRVAILTQLGFEIPQEIDDLAADDASYSEISAEQLELLDRDILVWELGSPEARDAVEDSPVYATLEAAQEDRDVFVDEEELVAAMAYISVLSLPTAIELLVPKLAAVLAGGGTASPSPTN